MLTHLLSSKYYFQFVPWKRYNIIFFLLRLILYYYYYYYLLERRWGGGRRRGKRDGQDNPSTKIQKEMFNNDIIYTVCM